MEQASTTPIPARQARYIVSPGYDWAFLLLPPAVALCLGMAISGTWFTDRVLTIAGQEMTGAALLIQILVHGHLVAVLLRSHGNPGIFKQYPVRFTLVPLGLYAAIVASDWVLVSVSVLATFWDVYHSGLQTFGFARIYDRKLGNDPSLGRRLDWWLNQLLYAGPILAGATMLDHFEDFDSFEHVGATFFTRIPVLMTSHQRTLAWIIIAAATVLVLWYVLSYVSLVRRGYRVSWLKVYLLASTGLCSIYTWGFNSWGEAFFIMNSFHAVQYLALVWATEGTRMITRSPLTGVRAGGWIGAGCFLGLTLGYGAWVATLDAGVRSLWAITLVVSIMHFWYDGFIWSVRRGDIR